jgi:hypothetical protein
MHNQSANINSPDVLKDFKIHFIKFGDTARQAIAGAKSDAGRTLQWLQHEQLHYWKRELQKADEMINRARSAYLLARFGSPHAQKASFIDEQKALRRAERRKEDVQRKIELVKRWAAVLEQQAEKMLGPVNLLGSVLEIQGPNARARLEAMIRNLEDYLRQAPQR